MILNAHAQRIDEDGDHDPTVEILALHDPFQLVAKGLPELGYLVPLLGWFPFLLFLVPLLLDLVP